MLRSLRLLPDRFSNKLILNFLNFKHSSNHRRNTSKNSRGNTLVGRFPIHREKMALIFQAYSFLKETVTRCNDALELKGHGPLNWWRYRLFWHCCWSLATGYIETISIHNLPIILVAERKNFKLLVSAGIILTVEVSILYFRPMRMVYAILLGWLSWAI